MVSANKKIKDFKKENNVALISMSSIIRKTPIISTDVGIANKILSKESIFEYENFNDAKPNIDVAYNNVQKYQIPNGFSFFEELFIEITKS